MIVHLQQTNKIYTHCYTSNFLFSVFHQSLCVCVFLGIIRCYLKMPDERVKTSSEITKFTMLQIAISSIWKLHFNLFTHEYWDGIKNELESNWKIMDEHPRSKNHQRENRSSNETENVNFVTQNSIFMDFTPLTRRRSRSSSSRAHFRALFIAPL